MLVPKKDRLTVYKYLFNEGVLVAHQDMANTTHAATNVANVYVVNLMRSFKSRELVRETFNWSHHYYYLTPLGIEYLREYLHLPEEIVPATLKTPARGPPRERRPDGDRRGGNDRYGRGDRGGDRYGDKKAGGPGSNWKPEYAGRGAGRGREQYRSDGGSTPAQ